MTRGRGGNNAYLYERSTGDEARDAEYRRHLPVRGTRQEATGVASGILMRDDGPVTAHQAASAAGSNALPARAAQLIEQNNARVAARYAAHANWTKTAGQFTTGMSSARHNFRGRARDAGRTEGLEC